MSEKRKAPKGCYWRGDSLWGRFKVAGVQIRRSLHTDDGKVAEGRLKAIMEKETAAIRFGDARASWTDAFMSWGNAIGGHAKGSTVARYASSLKMLAPYLKPLFVDEINRAVINDIVRQRRAGDPQTGVEGVTNATIRRDLTALSSVLGHCEDQGWRDDNPALTALRRIKERRDPIVLPELKDIDAVIARAPGLFAEIIRAALLTGCRLDELRRLETQHLDFQRDQISVYKTKRSKVRVIEMRAAREPLFKIPTSLHTKAVFWHERAEDGQPASPYLNVSSNFRRIVAAEAKAAKEAKPKRDFRPFAFHHLRHRFAVDYLKSGGGIYHLSHHLGHTSVKTTEIYLAYLTAEEAQAAKNR